jgi:hypothetical protein
VTKTSFEMAENGDDPIANWQEIVTSLRKRGRISGAALAVIPGAEIDVRLGRPPPPERLSQPEKDLWQRLVSSRRPQWFSGRLEILETYVVTISQVQRLEVALRKAPAGIGERYLRLLRAHRQAAGLASLLATRLRLTPGSKLDTRTPTDGDLPVG